MVLQNSLFMFGANFSPWVEVSPIETYFKGAMKLYFMSYLHVVIILFSTGLYKSAFSTYSFAKTRFSSFCVLVSCVSVYLAFNFQFCFMFWIECLKRLSKSIMCSLILFSLYSNDLLKYKNCVIKTCYQRGFFCHL